MMQSARGIIQELWREFRKTRKRLILIGEAVFYTLIIEGVLLGVVALTAFKLLDWQLILSLAVAEVPIGVFISILLGERRGQPYRAIEHLNAMVQFRHLHVHRAQAWVSADYPELAYYVVNTRTNRAFWVQDELRELVKGEIIRRTKYENREELTRYFEQNHIVLENRYGTLEELGLGMGVLSED